MRDAARLLPLLFLMTSCVEIPSPEHFQFETREQLQAAGDVLAAADTADTAVADVADATNDVTSVADGVDAADVHDAEDVAADAFATDAADADAAATDVASPLDAIAADGGDADAAPEVADSADASDAVLPGDGGSDVAADSADAAVDLCASVKCTAIACKSNVCDAKTGQCVATSVTNGIACDDGNACTSGDKCGGGICLSGAATNCDDGNPCTDDACAPASGCSHLGNSANPCSDGKSCTTEACVGATCSVTKVTAACADGNLCTDEVCDPGAVAANGVSGCVYLNNAATCSDANACTLNDTCASGACAAGFPDLCDDGISCSADSCIPASGCAHVTPAEACNGVDDDCDGLTDEADAVGCTPYYADVDQDGYGGGAALCLCGPTGGYTAKAGDCDDTLASVHPNAMETCDNVDNNCATGTDEGCDDDGDKYCDDGMFKPAGVFVSVCPFSNTASGKGDDCDDDKPAIKPGAAEICDNYDNNCATGTDEGCDDDGDGYCDSAMAKIAGGIVGFCPLTAAAKNVGDDCDDKTYTSHPNAKELCNGVDDNCDGTTDENGVALCDDGNACTTDACQAGSCKTGNLPDTTPCGTGTPCTGSDVCQSGVCAAGLPHVWEATIGGTLWERAKAVAATTDGGAILAGLTIDSANNSENDIWIVKTDSHGVKQWDKAIGGPGTQNAWGVVQTSDGNFSVAGTPNGSQLLIVRLGANGALLSSKTFDYAGNSGGLVRIDDGGIAVASAKNTAGNSSDFALIRMDTDGNKIWDATYGGSGADAAGGLTQTADRGFALVGQTASKGAGKNDFWLVRTDRNGTQMFDRAYGGTEDDTANGVVQMADGGFAIVGTTMSKGAGGADIWLVRTDSNGNKLWDRTYGGSSEEDGNGLAQLADGSLVVAAYSMSSELGSILRLDPQGNLVASNNTGTGAGRGTGMAIAAAGTTGVFVAGSRDSGTADFWLTRTDLWANMSCAKSGTCFAGTASSCDDGNQCTQDTCTFATGCSHTTWPATTPCNDGKDCTVGETCSAGGTCGGATNAASGTLCSDGNACTSGEACSSGVCTAGSGISCANDATCEAGVGCVCNPGYLGSGAQSGGSCNCKGTVVTVTLASGTQSACTYDYPVWGQRGLTPTTLKDNGNGTVGDSQTLLMWEQAVNNVTYTHADAVTHCDGLVLAGYADWRLPTYAELESIMDYSGNTSGAVIDTTLFPVAVDSVYRTMSVPDIVAGNRWTLDVFGGYADFQGDTQPHSVRCVRTHGARVPPSTHWATANNVVTDNATGLLWQQNMPSTTYLWVLAGGAGSAQDYCNTLSWGGYGAGGWRLPTIRELRGIEDHTAHGPAIYSAFNASVSAFLWTSTIAGGGVWAMDTWNGRSYSITTGSYAAQVLCTR